VAVDGPIIVVIIKPEYNLQLSIAKEGVLMGMPFFFASSTKPHLLVIAHWQHSATHLAKI
jgi:hypothetical protein